MKTLHSFLPLSATAALLIAVNLATAQDQPRPERPRGDAPAGERRPEGGPERRPEGGQFRGGPGGPGGMPMVELTEAQRDAMRSAMEDHREEMNQLGEKMRDARNGLQEAIFAEKQDAQKIESHAKEVAELQAQMTMIQAKMFAAVRSKFTPDQLEKLKRTPIEFLMRGGFQGRGGPGGPGFGPGGEGRRPGGNAPDGADGKRPEGARTGRPRPDAEPK